MERDDTVLSTNGMPSDAAARPVATSASLLTMPCTPTGPSSRGRFILSPDMIDRLLLVILLISAATIAVCSLYGFDLPDNLEDMYQLREQLALPAVLNYLTGTCI